MLSKTNHYSRLTVLALTRHVKSTLNWSHVDVNTARDLLSLKSDKNSNTIKEGLCGLNCYRTKRFCAISTSHYRQSCWTPPQNYCQIGANLPLKARTKSKITWGGTLYSIAVSLFVNREMALLSTQSCKMSMSLHRANLSFNILPQEKRVKRNKFSTYNVWN